MDRVQKSKLSLYKKAMEVSARSWAWGVAGLSMWAPAALDWAPGTGLASDLHPATPTAAWWVLGAALDAKAPHGLAQTLLFGGS